MLNILTSYADIYGIIESQDLVSTMLSGASEI